MCKILNIVRHDLYNRSLVEKIFRECDIDADGIITITHFYSFVAKEQSMWNDIFTFHEEFLNFFFPERHYKNILYRVMNKNKIRDYTKSHNGTFPQEKCLSKTIRNLKSLPPVYKYDYYCFNNSIDYFDTVNMFIIENIYPGYEKQIFLIKHLESYINYPVTNEIDKFFSEYLKKHHRKSRMFGSSSRLVGTTIASSRSRSTLGSSRGIKRGSVASVTNDSKIHVDNGRSYGLLNSSNQVMSVSRNVVTQKTQEQFSI